MNDIMIDLETLSTRHDAAILSIGLCLFDITTGKIGQSYQTKINMEDVTWFGHISADTVEWWLKQPKEAQARLLDGEKIYLAEALNRLSAWSRMAHNIWSNGASFDLVILRSAYERHGLTTPWHYWQERDTRTLVDIAKRITGIDAKKETPFDGTQHDALSDAIHQAKYVSKAFELLQTGVTR
ncbi:3'-5' exonuclease [Methylomonas rapida]|uniref:3'-5' exoribonuclease n=1 Tax=Methylomonas rapida TaxID=2963939 RepID=A0ABY7GIR5_9GAMM|nr:3'-5' exonuclease [Methylomonas rapida]WAR44204.1 3'-5' exoribonuclease [Methylomonas rapida]WAR46921.1 3'-5' exoribonuclease [Methylomonas rapida]